MSYEEQISREWPELYDGKLLNIHERPQPILEKRMAATMDDSDFAHTPQKGQPKALRFVTNYGAPHPKR